MVQSVVAQLVVLLHILCLVAEGSTDVYSTAQHSPAQHSTAQRSTAQHSTAQHSTAKVSYIMG